MTGRLLDEINERISEVAVDPVGATMGLARIVPDRSTGPIAFSDVVEPEAAMRVTHAPSRFRSGRLACRETFGRSSIRTV
jgi:hypothetical protein